MEVTDPGALASAVDSASEASFAFCEKNCLKASVFDGVDAGRFGRNCPLPPLGPVGGMDAKVEVARAAREAAEGRGGARRLVANNAVARTLESK